MSYKIKNSKIHGKGAFADRAYKKGEQISNEADYTNETNQSLLSFFHNHDEKNANMNYVMKDGGVNLIANKDIKAGDELVSNYYDMQYPGSPYEDPSKFEKKTLGKRKRKLKEGGGPGDPPDKKTPIKSIFTDPRYKEYRKIKKENKSIEDLNKQLDLARDAYNKRWSVIDNYTDSAAWEASPEFKGFIKYKKLVPPKYNKSYVKHFKTGPEGRRSAYKGWGDADWDASKKELVENYKKELPRYNLTKEEYDEYIDWAEKKNPEYFKKYNIRKLLKGLPIQNQVARSMWEDIPYTKEEDEKVIEDVKKVEEDIINTIEEIPVFDKVEPLPITDPNLKPFETEQIEFEPFPEPQKMSEFRREKRQDRRDSRGPGALSRFFENLGKPKPRYRKQINKQNRRFRRNVQDGGLAKFLIGGPKSREQVYEESLADTGVESGDLSDFNTAGTDAIYYLDNPDYFKNNPINTGNPKYDAQVKKAIFEDNMGWNPHNQSIYFKQWEAPESMQTLLPRSIESIDQNIVEREISQEPTWGDVKADPRFEVLFRETEEEADEDSKQTWRKIKQDGRQKRSKTPRVIIGKGRRRTGLKNFLGLQEGGMVNELSRFLDGGPTKTELAYFVDDAGKPFKYKGKTWSDVVKLSEEEQREYAKAFSTYESDRDNRQYESNIKSKLDPFYKVDLYGGGKTVWGDKSKASGKYEYEEMASKLERLYKEKFPDEKAPKLETISDFNKIAKAIELPTYFINEPNGGFSMASNRDVANRIYNKGLTATQLSKMGFGSRAEIQDYFAPIFEEHQRVYDKRNLENITKDIEAGVSVKDAIQKIADRNEGTVEGLTKLYKEIGDDYRNIVLKDIKDLVRNEYGNVDFSYLDDAQYFDPLKMGKKSAYTTPLKLKEQIRKTAKSQEESEQAMLDNAEQRINNPQGYYADNTVIAPSYFPITNDYDFSISSPKTLESQVDGITGAMNPNAKVGSTRGYDSEQQFRDKTAAAVTAQKLLQNYYGIDNLEQLNNLTDEQNTNLIKTINNLQKDPEYNEDLQTKALEYYDDFNVSSNPFKYFKVSDLEEDQKFWGPLFNQITGTKTFSEKPVVYSLQDNEPNLDNGIFGNNEYERALFKQKTKPKGAPAGQITLPTKDLIGVDLDINPITGVGNIGVGIKSGNVLRNVLKNTWRNPISQTTGINKLSRLTGLSSKVPNIVKQGVKLASPRNIVNTHFAMNAPEYLSEVPTNFSDAYSDFSSGNVKDALLDLGMGAINASSILPFVQAGKRINTFGNTIKGGKSYIPSTNLGKYSFTAQSPSGRTQFGIGAQGDPLTRKSILDLKLPGTQGRFNISKFNEKPGSSLLLEKTGGVIKLPKNKKLPKHNFRGVVKNLAKYYPDMEKVGSGLLTPEYVKRIKDIAKLKSFLTYAGNINKNLGDNRKILNYNIGKMIADSDINYGDIVDSRRMLFNYDMDNRGVVNRILKEEGVESLLRRVLGATGQKDFSQLKPFGDIEMSAYGAKNRYDHEGLMSQLYQNPDYNDSPLPFTEFQSGDYFTPDKDFTQQYFDEISFDYDIANPFGSGSKVLGTIKDALPVFYAKNFRTPRETAIYGIESINHALHNARPRTFITDAGSKTPDSYLMGANQLIKNMNTYPEILGNTQFIGYSTLNREAFSDAFFKGKEKAINQGELRGPYTGSPRAVADKNQEFFNRLRGEFTSDALNKIYSKYNFEGLPAISLPTGVKSTSAIQSRNRGLGAGSFYSKPGETFFPNYAIQKLRPMSLEEALKIKFEEGGYALGDEVDEHMVEELRRRGYTLEEV